MGELTDPNFSRLMQRNASFWFGWPKEELPSAERARQAARRQAQLEPHILQSRSEPLPSPAGKPIATRVDIRDPQELVRGVDVQELSDSAYDRLFTPDEPAGGAAER